MLLLAAFVGADAHAFLVLATPTAGAVLSGPPAEVELRFSEPVTPFGRGIDVYSPAGRLVAAPARAAGNALTARLDLSVSPEPGTYVVQWRVIAQDTHPSRGTFTFSIGHPGAPFAETASPAILAGVPARGVVLQSIARFSEFAGFAALFGALILDLMILHRPPSADLRGMVRLGIVLLASGAPLSVVAQAVSLGGLDAASLADVTASPLGRVAALQLGGALLLWAVLPAFAGSRRGALTSIVLLAAALAAADGLAGHAGTGSAFWVTWLATAVHVAAMGTWVGVIGAALLLLHRRAADAQTLVRRVAPVAASALGLAILSGAALAVLHLRNPADLAVSPYGTLLTIKTLAVGAAMAAALLSRRRGRPLGLEAGAMIGILALASVLGSIPPLR